VNGNREDDQEIAGLQAALGARSVMKSWAEGLELIELVYAAGFRDAEIIDSPLGRLVVLRKPGS
jgi:hypothetical protein